jgi:hypothetical protein
MWGSVAARRRLTPNAFGFCLQTAGNLSRVNDLLYDARARLGDEGAHGETWARSVRRPPTRSGHGVARNLAARIVA